MSGKHSSMQEIRAEVSNKRPEDQLHVNALQDAMPILARDKAKFEKPPPCSIKTVRFKNLR
jgi:hypothetical protein